MTLPSLSVIVPNFNHAHFIGEALEAILEQSLKPHELIVVDDASTDDSLEVLDALRGKNPAIRLVRNEKNLGVVESVNRQARLASGAYVYFAAADDKILPGFFERSIGLLSRHPQAGLCSTRSLLLGEHGETLGPYRMPVVAKTERYLPPRRIASIYKKFGDWVAPNTAIFRREAFLEFGGLDPALGGSSDGFLHHAISLKYGACYIPEPLAMWRQLETSYAATYTTDVRAAIGLVERLEHRMRDKHGDLFPPGYAELFKLRALRSVVYGLSRRDPYRHDLILEVGQAMRFRGPLDRIYFAGLRLYLEAGRWATKLYILLQHPLPDQLRIILKKLRRLASKA